MGEYKRIYLDKQNFIQNKAEQFDYTFIRSSLNEYTSTKSSLVRQFEVEVAKNFNLDFNNVIATNSGTSALHLAIKVTRASRIILPVTTFIATGNAAKYTGAYLDFCDINENTWCIDNTKLFERINIFNPHLVLFVDLYGNISNIIGFPESENISIIVDASHSFGLFPDKSRLNKVDYFCYSFNGNKTITTGAGGLIVSKEYFKNDNIKSLLQQGLSSNIYDEYTYVGYNYKMAGINAALGLMQLQYLDFFINRKNRINEIYRNELKDVVKFQEPEPYVKPVWWMTACLFDEGIDIEDLMKKLDKYNIETRRIFKPLNRYKPYHSNQRFPVAEMIYDRGLCLPSSTVNTDEDIFFVCQTIKEILGERK